MIVRIWHGYTTNEKAGIYEKLLKEEIFLEIQNKNIKGFKEIQLLKRDAVTEIEFVTIMWFDNIDSVKQFAGEDYSIAVVPAKAQNILTRFDSRSLHFNLL